MHSTSEASDLLVFSHLRWDHIYQRPHHVLSRHARNRRVFYYEDPIYGMTEIPRLHIKETSENVLVVIPHLPTSLASDKIQNALKDLLDELIYEEEIVDFTLWYYSPEALNFSSHLEAKAVIFDCLEDSLNHSNCEELLKKSDLVFTASQSLFESKKEIHHNIHPVPSSLEKEHFVQARHKLIEPDDQINIPKPRIGYYGTINEKLDFDLILESATLKPHYQFVVAGPVENLDSQTLPKRNNIHYLGPKDYHALPLYLAGWDCAFLPFKINESTQFTSPVEALEFLAGGKPVISTRIQDMVSYYGTSNLVTFIDSAETLIAAIEMAEAEKENTQRIIEVDDFLHHHSWDFTASHMIDLESNLFQSNSNYLSGNKTHPLSSGVI